MVKIICTEEQREAQDIFNEVKPKFNEIIVVESQGDIDRFMVEIKYLKEQKKIIEEKRTSITVPLDTAKKNTQALFNPMKEAIDKAIREREGCILTYTRQKQQEIADAEALLKASQPVPKDELEEMEQQAEVAQVVSEKPKVKGVTKYYSMVVFDERLVPKEFLIPNESLLNTMARTHKEKFTIPGCKLVIKEVIK